MNAADSATDSLDDATLEQLFFGGRTTTSQTVETEGALTSAQEDALYREGVIPAPAEAEALEVAAKEAELLGEDALEEIHGGLDNLGHKWALPQRPYAEGFNHKKRYHPVLEQITRLLMRDGKLSVAQRVRIPPRA